MAFRFLHVADLHLETVFGGRSAVRERLRRATHEAFERAVDYALDNRLDAVLAAGDLFDDPLLSPRTELWLSRQVRRLAEGGVWFLASCGNHDPGGPGHRAARLGLGGDEEWQRRTVLFRAPAPEVVEITDRDGRSVGLVIGAGHSTATESRNLAATFPQTGALPEHLPVVGLLHTWVAASRSQLEHERYAPSSVADYERLAYGYWALGHIHERQQAVSGLPVWYAGNLQGRHSRETGPKGGLVVEAHPGAPAEPEFVRFAPVRWERLRADDLPDAGELEVLVEHVARRLQALDAGPHAELAARVELSGPTPLAATLRCAETRADLEDEIRARVGALEVQLRIDSLALPADGRDLGAAPSVFNEALELVERALRDDALLAALAPEALAAAPELEGEARLAYLRELLTELPEDLVQRALGADLA